MRGDVEAPEPARWRRVLARATRPLRRMWGSDDALEDYALVHLASVGGDTLLAIALADSIFFSLPVGEARAQVALYLALTMAPLAVAGPLLVPLLDRSPYRRATSFVASLGRAALAIFAAANVDSLLLFPATFGILVLSKIHAIAKHGLTVAYAPTGRELVRSNAFLGRVAIGGFALAAVPGVAVLAVGGAGATLLAAGCVYLAATMLGVRLAPAPLPESGGTELGARGRLPHLAAAAVGNGALRGAQGAMLALMAFALRAAGSPTYWFGALVVAGTAGAAVGDMVAHRLPRAWREELVVLGSVVGAGIAALFAFQTFSLPTLAIFVGLAGMATEFGRLAFQSLMQTNAPGGAQGRVFVRYEVVFQLAWVAGALIPSMLPIPFRAGVLAIGVFYLALGLPYLVMTTRRSGPG